MIAPPILHKDDYSIRIAASAAESAAAGDLPVKLAAAPGAPCDVHPAAPAAAATCAPPSVVGAVIISPLI